MSAMEKRAGVARGVAQGFDAIVLTGTTLTTPLIAQARESRDLAISLRTDPSKNLQPSIVAIVCAALAVEAEVNWVSIRDDRPWHDRNERQSPPTKWRLWIQHRTGITADMQTGLGLRIVELFRDRDMIAHYRGVPDLNGGLEIHQPPKPNDSITAVQAHFTPERAARHVGTAEEAIAGLSEEPAGG
jgi:hypothetical protein